MAKIHTVEPITITGMGVICSIAHNLTAMTQSLRAGDGCICSAKEANLHMSAAGCLKHFNMNKLKHLKIKRIKRYVL